MSWRSGSRLILFEILIALLVSCSNADHVPRGILPKERMTNLLTDLQLASSYNQSFTSPQDTFEYPQQSEQRLNALYQQVFQLYDIDTTQFFKSFRYYTNHPRLYQTVFEDIEDSLEAKLKRQEAIDAETRRQKADLRTWNNLPKDFLVKSIEERQQIMDTLSQRTSKPINLQSLRKTNLPSEEKRLPTDKKRKQSK